MSERRPNFERGVAARPDGSSSGTRGSLARAGGRSAIDSGVKKIKAMGRSHSRAHWSIGYKALMVRYQKCSWPSSTIRMSNAPSSKFVFNCLALFPVNGSTSGPHNSCPKCLALSGDKNASPRRIHSKRLGYGI